MTSDPHDPATAIVSAGDVPRADEARFTPGTIVGGRYRIVSLVGEGGMGEVYRADDLKLGQRVALKYVPAAVSDDRAAFERVCAEVRIGRQISHPNVCRIHDIVDVDGQFFIAMEYVDGEDLASLLRRIGRLPPDKALALTRDLCAGLAAAHERGIIHRDLKPANIMINGHGDAQITDFGLAALGQQLHGVREIAGTPAYMSPEQLRGDEITVRSDLYALGLIMYEMFTGRRVFSGLTLAAIRQEHSIAKPCPSSLLRDLDPAVERAILSCLEEDPRNRPASIHAVMAAVPGGDPLQAAIAAGQTPSPQQVAAAALSGELSAGRAWCLLGAVFVSLLVAVWVADRGLLTGILRNIKSREVLTDRAAEVVRAMGYADVAHDHTVAFETNSAYLLWIASGRGRDWSLLRQSPPSALRFVYRDSPLPLVAKNSDGIVTASDPAENLPGMTTVHLDQDGRLRYFRRVPDPWPGSVHAVDWGAVFAQASLDLGAFKPATPDRTPPYGFDRRMAWTGMYPNRADLKIRIEAATHSGRPVYFHVVEPWEQRSGAKGAVPAAQFGNVMFDVVVVGGLIMGAILARRNVRRGRGDKRGALRIAIYVSVCSLVGSLLVANHTVDVREEWRLLQHICGPALWFGLGAWIWYLALEPYVRNRWPHMLISWTRFLSGRWLDPLIGRDILIGAIAGSVVITFFRARVPLSHLLGEHAVPENPLVLVQMSTALGIGYELLQSQILAIRFALGWLALLVIIRLVVRNDKIALAVLIFLLGLIGFNGAAPIAGVVVVTAAIATFLYVLYRFGLLAVAIAVFVRRVLAGAITLDFTAWYALHSTALIVIVAAIAVYGFYISLAGKSPLGRLVLEEEPATTS